MDTRIQNPSTETRNKSYLTDIKKEINSKKIDNNWKKAAINIIDKQLKVEDKKDILLKSLPAFVDTFNPTLSLEFVKSCVNLGEFRAIHRKDKATTLQMINDASLFENYLVLADDLKKRYEEMQQLLARQKKAYADLQRALPTLFDAKKLVDEISEDLKNIEASTKRKAKWGQVKREDGTKGVHYFITNNKVKNDEAPNRKLNPEEIKRFIEELKAKKGSLYEEFKSNFRRLLDMLDFQVFVDEAYSEKASEEDIKATSLWFIKAWCNVSHGLITGWSPDGKEMDPRNKRLIKKYLSDEEYMNTHEAGIKENLDEVVKVKLIKVGLLQQQKAQQQGYASQRQFQPQSTQTTLNSLPEEKVKGSMSSPKQISPTKA